MSQMKSFWQGYAKDASVNEMMLDTNATTLSSKEIPEVLSFLPDYKGKKILELAGGIGRFTGILAEKANHVTTVDFIEEFIMKNKESNKGHKNIDYIVDDVMNLTFEKESLDLIFINWLFIYLNDEDMTKLIERMLLWMKDGAYLFFRESCLKGSGNFFFQNNPTVYRSPEQYNYMFEQRSSLNLIFARNLQSYIKCKQDRNQICWLMQKCQDNDRIVNRPPAKSVKKDSIIKLRSSPNVNDTLRGMCDDGLLTIKNNAIEEEYVKMLDLKASKIVLDVGCGIGNMTFHIAKEYAVEVFGIDSSNAVINLAWEKKNKEHGVSLTCFEIGDIALRQYEADFFDVIYSSEDMTDRTDKVSLLRQFMTWLKPGGKLLFRDYCWGQTIYPEDENCSAQYSIQDYINILRGNGFVNIKTTDVSSDLMMTIKGARLKANENRQIYLTVFKEEELLGLRAYWDRKFKQLENQQVVCCLFYAEKHR